MTEGSNKKKTRRPALATTTTSSPPRRSRQNITHINNDKENELDGDFRKLRYLNGECPTCGIQTHGIHGNSRKSINNRFVVEGRCLHCNKTSDCTKCGIQTHKIKGDACNPINSQFVLEGRCLLCNPLPKNTHTNPSFGPQQTKSYSASSQPASPRKVTDKRMESCGFGAVAPVISTLTAIITAMEHSGGVMAMSLRGIGKKMRNKTMVL